MSSLTAITAARLLTHDHVLELPLLLVEDGVIIKITTQGETAIPAAAKHLNFSGQNITPTFLDVHVHGAAGHDVMEATPAALNTVGKFLATRGVAHFLPTTVTAPLEETLRALESIAGYIDAKDQTGAMPLGIHLEGPFLSHTKRGVHSPELLQPPSVELFDRFWQTARGHIKLMTIAPEVPGALELIAHATAKGVRISIGHSNATLAEARAGIRAGAVSATHTFNAMRALDHREPGIAGAVLDEKDLFAEIICDGIHVAPEMVRLYWLAKGPHRAMLITDGISATGMPDGEYMLGHHLRVQVKDGRCTSTGSQSGVLAGSVLTMDRAVANFKSFTGAPLQQVAMLASRNPAQMLGLSSVGLAVGAPANLNLLADDGSLTATMLRGQLQE